MSERKTLFITTRHDDITGGVKTLIRRAWQPKKKDGTDARRPARLSNQMLVRYPDGSWRYYGREGVLRRERVSAERWSAEATAPSED